MKLIGTASAWLRTIVRAGLVAACFGMVAADQIPGRYDETKNAFVVSGESMYEFRLIGPAIKWDKACRGGSAKDCRRLAEAYEGGLGAIRADDRVSLGYYMMACDAGDNSACARTASLIFNWTGIAKSVRNPGRAQAYAEKGCNQKNQASCAVLGQILEDSDPARAIALMDAACAAGDMDGCRMRAEKLFYMEKTPESRAAALPLLVKGCEAKTAWGCAGLADAYENGWGVARDGQKAMDYARRGCVEGSIDGRLYACRLHGMYLTYVADKESFNTGEQYLHVACMARDGEACAYLGKLGLRRKNSGMTTTLEEGLYYLRRACDLDVTSGCRELANAYYEGVGVTGDAVVAWALYDKACRMKMKSACTEAKDIAAQVDVQGRMPAIDPSLPAQVQIDLAVQTVEAGRNSGTDLEPPVMTVYRLVQEGHDEASWILGGWMYYGLPTVFDPPRKKDGLILFDNAARVGHVKAAIFMGMAYWYGEEGLPEDQEKGARYMAIAASRGDEMAGAIYESMLNEPARQEMEARRVWMEHLAQYQEQLWAQANAEYQSRMSGSYSSSSYSTPSYSGPSTSQIIDNSNWNQMFNYMSGSTSACPSSNPYC